jgi:hypothetical protein
MANEGNVSWTQRTGKIGPAVYVTSKGGGMDFVGTATSIAANGAYPVDGILTIINSNPYSDGISNRYRFYSTNNGKQLFAEKNGKIYRVSDDDLRVMGEVPSNRIEFVGLIDDNDVKGLGKFHYENKTIQKVRKSFGFADGGMMAKGGVTFDDKVKAIKKRLEGMSVAPKFRKEYGKTMIKKKPYLLRRK